MAKQITRKEIAEDDLFGDIRRSSDETTESIEGLNAKLVASAKILQKDLNSALVKDTKSLREFAKATSEANRIMKDAVRLEKVEADAITQGNKARLQEEKIKQEKIKTEMAEQRQAQQLEKAKLAQARAEEKAAKVAAAENDAYKKLSKTTRDNKNESKRLAVEMMKLEKAGGRSTAAWRKLEREYRAVTRAAQLGDAQLKKIDATVGDNFRNVGNYTGAVGKLKTGLAQLGVAFGAFQVLRTSYNTVRDFEAAVADLSAITGATGRELDFLKNKSLEFSTKFGQSAKDIVEAFKLAGSARPELLKNGEALADLTEKAIILSKASGDDVPTSINNLAGTLNAFDEPASKAGEVMDTLANASLKGSKEIPYLTEAFTKFGGIAAKNKVSIAESAASLEFLGKKIPEAATAGTSLRDILSKLSAPGVLPKEAFEGLSAAMEANGHNINELADKNLSFSERLKLLSPLLQDNELLVRAFGQENQLAAQILIENADAIGTFAGELGTAGTATEQMETKSKTLGEAVNKLSANWDAFVIGLSEGSGAGNALTGIVDSLSGALNWLSQNADTVIAVMSRVIRLFVVYKVTMLALKMKERVSEFIEFQKSLNKTESGLGKATPSVKAFGAALKGIGLSLVISLLIEVVSALWDFASGAAGARHQQELFNQAIEKGNEALDKLREKNKDALQGEINGINEKRSLNQISDKEAATQSKNALKRQRKIIEAQIAELRVRYQKIEVMRQEAAANKKRAEDEAQWYDYLKAPADNAIVTQEMHAEKVRILAAEQKKVRTIIEGLQDDYKGLTQETFDAGLEINNLSTAASKSSKQLNEMNSEFSNQIDLLKELNEMYKELKSTEQELVDLQIGEQIAEVSAELERVIEVQKENVESTGGFDFTGTMDLIKQRNDLEMQAIIERRDFEVKTAEQANDLKFKAMQEALEKERQELISSAEQARDEVLKDADATGAEKAAITTKYNQAIKKIEENYQAEVNKLKILELQGEENLQAEIINIKEEANNELLDLERERISETEQLNNDLVKGAEDFAAKEQEKAAEEQKKIQEGIEAEEKAAAKRRMDLAKLVSDYLIAQSDKRIEALEKEAKAHEDMVDELKKLAAEGNINAQQSIAEEQRLADEANKAKLEEEKRKQRVELASTAFSAYQSNVEAGSEQPLADTIRDITLLQAFINSLPAFYEGTETTVGKALGAPSMPGRDGYIVRVDGDEKILNPGLSKMTGNLTTEEIARIAQDYNTGRLVARGEGAVQIGGPWESSVIIDKLEGIARAIQDKPETVYNLEQVVDRLFVFLKSTKNGSSVLHQKFRVDA